MSTDPPTPSKRPLLFAAGCLLAIPLLLALTYHGELNKYYVCGRWAKKWALLVLVLLWLAAGGLAAWRGRRPFFGFALASVMGGCALVLLELLGILGVLDYAGALGTRDTGTGVGYQAKPHVVWEGPHPGNITFEWSLRNREDYPVEFRSDHRGFRNPTDRDGADIYLVGDSFVVSGLVRFEGTLAGILEPQLEREIMHVALTGLSPRGARDLLLESEPPIPLENRLVVQFLFEGNDLRDTVWDRQAKHEPEPPSLRVRSLTSNLLEVFTRWSLPAGFDPGHDRSATFEGETYYFKEIHGWDEELAKEVPTVMGTLQEVREVVESAGGRYLVAMFPSKLRVLSPYCTFPADTQLEDPEAIYGPNVERFREACAEAGIPYLDFTPALRAASERGEATFFTDDTHLNAHGMKVCAEALASWEPFRSWVADTR